MSVTAVPVGHFSGQRAIEKNPGGDDTRDLRELLNELIVVANAGTPSPVTTEQAVAASLDDIVFVAPADGTITSLYAKAGTTAAAGESMDIDIEIGGVAVLTAALTLDATAGTTAQEGTIDTAANSFSAGDVIEITRAYTAGGTPTPMANTIVSIGVKLES